MRSIFIPLILLIVTAVVTFYLTKNSEHRKLQSYYDICMTPCLQTEKDIEIKYQECTSLQSICENFECKEDETPRACFERRREVCRSAAKCWADYNSLVKEYENCVKKCNIPYFPKK